MKKNNDREKRRKNAANKKKVNNAKRENIDHIDNNTLRKKNRSEYQSQRLHSGFSKNEKRGTGRKAYHSRQCGKNAVRHISSEEGLNKTNKAASQTECADEGGNDIGKQCRCGDGEESDEDGKSPSEEHPYLAGRLRSCGDHKLLLTINALGAIGTVVFTRIVIGIVTAATARQEVKNKAGWAGFCFLQRFDRSHHHFLRCGEGSHN